MHCWGQYGSLLYCIPGYMITVQTKKEKKKTRWIMFLNQKEPFGSSQHPMKGRQKSELIKKDIKICPYLGLVPSNLFVYKRKFQIAIMLSVQSRNNLIVTVCAFLLVEFCMVCSQFIYFLTDQKEGQLRRKRNLVLKDRLSFHMTVG